MDCPACTACKVCTVRAQTATAATQPRQQRAVQANWFCMLTIGHQDERQGGEMVDDHVPTVRQAVAQHRLEQPADRAERSTDPPPSAAESGTRVRNARHAAAQQRSTNCGTRSNGCSQVPPCIGNALLLLMQHHKQQLTAAGTSRALAGSISSPPGRQPGWATPPGTCVCRGMCSRRSCKGVRV